MSSVISFIIWWSTSTWTGWHIGWIVTLADGRIECQPSWTRLVVELEKYRYYYYYYYYYCIHLISIDTYLEVGNVVNAGVVVVAWFWIRILPTWIWTHKRFVDNTARNIGLQVASSNVRIEHQIPRTRLMQHEIIACKYYCSNKFIYF
jgi:hypothetical protein